MITREKIAGVVFGTAIGDALGYPREFAEAGQNPVTRASIPRLYSDDTQMFRAVAEGLLRARTWTDLDAAAEEVAEEIISWSRSAENNRAPGAACMLGARNLAEGVAWRDAGKRDGGGCGAAMRSMAYGIWLADPMRAAEWAADHAAMTHRSPPAQASAAAVAAIISSLLAGCSPEEAVRVGIACAREREARTADLMAQAVRYAEEYRALPLAGARILADQILDRWRGWTGHEAVAASVFCFLAKAGNFPGTLILAVNSSGDSDSLGAIAGAFAGAYQGLEQIPAEWRASVERSAELEVLAGRLSLVLRGTR